MTDRSASFEPDDELVEPALAVAFARPPPSSLGESVLDTLGRLSGAIEAFLPPLPPDEAGRYRVAWEVGRGGTGVVYQGHDRDLERDVALKLLRPDRIGVPRILDRFLGEARVVSRLEHPGIAPVYDVGFVRDNLPYIAMALLRGRPLSSVLAAREDLSDDLRALLGIFGQVCHTVAHAHARGVVHRDLKPANVMVGAYGEVYVIDWGLARADAEPDAPSREGGLLPPRDGSLSVEGQILGTPAYMPPEQARGDLARISPRSDVFALGGILLEILTGQPPYLGTTSEVVLTAARGDLSGANARLDACGADPAIVALARACLAPDPADRPADGAAVARAVEEHLAADEERSWRATMDAARDRLRREAEEERERIESRRSAWEAQAQRRTLGIGAALVATLLLAGGFLLYRQASATERDRATVARVDDALRQAARAEGGGDALAAESWAHRAVDHARLGDADAEVVARAEAALARAGIAADAARSGARDARLFARLDRADERVRAGQGVHAAEAAYAEAFADRGVDPRETSAERIAEAFRGTTSPADVAAALEAWARLRLRQPGALASDAKPLREAARLLAPDPAREGLVSAALAGDLPAFREAARTAQDRVLPRRTLHLVSEILSLREQQDLARPILLAAWQRHPEDVRVNELISVALGGLFAPSLHASSRPASAAEAVPHALAAVALRPGDPHAWLLLARALDAAGERKRAEEACRRALEIDAPDPPRDHRAVLADVLAHDGRLADAIPQFLAAVEARPEDTYLWARLGSCYRRLGRYDESLDAFGQGLRREPTDAPLLALRGETLAAMGRPADAERSFRAAVEHDPAIVAAWMNLALLLSGQERFEEAAATYRAGLEAVPDQPSMLHNLGLVLVRVERAAEAVPYLQRCLEVGPVDPAETWMGLASAYDQLGRVEDQERVLHRVVELAPKHAGARTNLAWILQARGDLDGALAQLAQALADEPTLMEAWYYQGYVQRAAQRFPEAIASLERALALAPDDHQIHFLLGVTCADGTHDYAKAAVHFRRVLEIRPNHENAAVSLALALRHLRDYPGALEALRRARIVAPDSVRPRVDTGLVLYLMEDWDRAVPALREALSMAPGEPTASALLASILTTTPDPTGKGPEEAIAVLDRAQVDPAWASQYRLLRGIALAYLRRDAEAAPLLEGAGDAGPAAAYALAAVRARQGRGADAKALFAQADALVAQTPSDPAVELRYLREMAERAMSGEGRR